MRAAGAILALLLAGCGFHLRGSATVPFNTLYIPGATTGIALDLKRNIEAGTQAKVVNDPKAADKEAIQALAIANVNVQKFVSGQAIKKIVVVPGRLINLVV